MEIINVMNIIINDMLGTTIPMKSTTAFPAFFKLSKINPPFTNRE